MEITHETKNGMTIFRLSGQLALLEVRDAKSKLAPFLEDDSVTSLFFDMENIKLLDSSGIGFLISTSKEMKKKQGTFGLFACNDLVTKIITSTNINNVIDIFTDENEALLGK
jgi:anti-sigma B factor antagonist